MKLGFFGTGKMATAIARGLVAADVWPVADIYGFDVNADALGAFEDAVGASRVDSVAALADSVDVCVLAVKPQNMPEAVTDSGADFAGTLVVSIAAGLTLDRLCRWFKHDRVVRVMPNTPAMVGRGAAVFSTTNSATVEDRQVVRRIFEAVGVVHEMDEEMIDAVTALSGSGPAYVFEMIQAMAEAAVTLGLEPDAALDLTVQTVAGAAEMVARGMGTPDQLRDAVTSKGGTTAAGLAVLDAAGFRRTMADVLRAARDRSVELGRG